MSSPDTGHQRVVIYWTLHNDAGDTIACELSRTERGLLVRCLDQARNIVLSERVAVAPAGGEVAAQWKARLLEKGDYFERPLPPASKQFKGRSERANDA